MMDLSKLSQPFDPAAVHWRVQGKPYERNGQFSAMALAYLDARDVMDRLDEVCGPGGWQSEFTETTKGRVICRLGVKVGNDWVWKSDGAGDTDVEGEKGGISDALKRAAVSWGIGRYLYRLDSPWVPCHVSQKNGQTSWKSWAVDPWTLVRGAPKPPPKSNDGPRKPYGYDDALDVIRTADTLSGLASGWKLINDAYPDAARDAAVIKAKDARKAELTGETV